VSALAVPKATRPKEQPSITNFEGVKMATLTPRKRVMELKSAMFGSAIGHFDVDDTREIFHDAYELVDHSLVTR
jgi:hypothetical protein